jgi:hypothetical protein
MTETPHYERLIARLENGDPFTKTGVVDNDFYGDSIIWIGEHDIDLDTVFKDLGGYEIELTIKVINKPKETNPW